MEITSGDKYICEISPEHLFYNIMYHINDKEHTIETRDKAIKNLIFGSIKKWEKNSNQ